MAGRVLLIAYQFPPVGGAGVQRAAKFTKYLPDCGWEVSVLTALNPSVPLHDNSLLRDVPDQTIIRRARTFEPSYTLKARVSAGGAARSAAIMQLKHMVRHVARSAANLVLQPDPQILWLPSALREGKCLLDEIRHDAIVATGPPFSSFLLGVKLSRYGRVPLILDYRDEWDLSNMYLENRHLDHLSLMIQRRMQRHVIRHAKALVTTTRYSATSLERLRDAADGSAKVTWIYNGFDPADFADITPTSEPHQRYRLLYTGTLWNLTSVQPLVEAMRLLSNQAPAVAARIELVFAGRRTADQETILNRLKDLPCMLAQHAYVDHQQSVQMLLNADGLCVLLSDVAGAQRVVPAKIFEYIAARKTILAILPRGELSDLLAGHPAAGRFNPGDIAGIANWLKMEVQRHQQHQSISCDCWPFECHARPAQAKQLAQMLREITSAAGLITGLYPAPAHRTATPSQT